MPPPPVYPWNLLGLSATADKDSIRRAYAARLKEVRPDEDAHGFQRLVEARDFALRLAASKEQPRIPLSVAAQRGGIRREDEAPRRDEASRSRATTSDTSIVIVEEIGIGPRPTLETADADRDIRRSPAAVLAALSAVLDEPQLNGWPNLVRDIGALTIIERAAIEAEILALIGRFATANPSLRNGLKLDSPFFDLLAALDGEFDWAGRDRAIYAALGAAAADDLVGVLDWIRQERAVSGRQTLAGRWSPRLPPLSRRDVHSFFDDGRDAAGLKAYRRFAQEPKLWRGWDAVTLLFFPFPALAARHYARAALGLFGWTALAVLFLPQTMPLLSIVLPAALSACLWLDFIVHAMGLGARLRKESPAAHQIAFVWFPVWAFLRGFPVRAAIGFIAWGGLLFRAATDEPGSMSLGAKADLLLIATLHATACAHGRRWVIERLVSAVRSADRKGLVDTERRARHLRPWALTRYLYRFLRLAGRIMLWTAIIGWALGIFVVLFEVCGPLPAFGIVIAASCVPALRRLMRRPGGASLRFWRNPRSSA